MNKLTLDLDALEIETFDTAPENETMVEGYADLTLRPGDCVTGFVGCIFTWGTCNLICGNDS